MPNPRFHIVPHDKGWAVKREGENKEEAVYPTQKEAIAGIHDKAQDEEADVVVHRQDGTFRKVINYSDSNGNGSSSSSTEKLSASDVFSVGCRINWGSVLAGACIAIAIYAALTVGGVALGLGLSNLESVRGKPLAWGAGVWMLLTTLISLFMGGFVVSQTTAGETKSEALVYGVVLWGFLFLVLTLFQALGATVGYQVYASSGGNPAAVTSFDDNRSAYKAAGLSDEEIENLEVALEENSAAYKQAGIDAEQAEKINKALEEATETASQTSAEGLAWWLFASIVISLGASVLGAFVGAGPKLVIAEMAARRMTVKPEAA